MTKARKIIISVAIILIFFILWFPFYWEGQFTDDHKLIREYLKWGIDPSVRDSFDKSVKEIWEYEKRRDIQLLGTVIILVLAAAAFRIAGRKTTDGPKRGRIKTQEAIILIATLITVLAILFPPCDRFTLSSKTLKIDKTGTGWSWILNTKEHGEFIWWAYKLSRLDATYPEIRYDVLFLEIFGILVLAGAGFLITKGNKKQPNGKIQ